MNYNFKKGELITFYKLLETVGYMHIITRYKDKTGTTVGYLIENNGVKSYCLANAVKDWAIYITNAILLANGEFKALSGYKIITVYLDDDTVGVTVDTNQISEPKNIDFYGKAYINICRRIRSYALAGKIVVSTERHKSNKGNNVHLFNLIRACGTTVEDFVRGYLSYLQPYSLEPFQRSEMPDDSVWLSDAGYGVKLVIKINERDKNKPVVVSFHESNLDGRYVRGGKLFIDKPCAVLVDDFIQNGINAYTVRFTVQRGFIAYSFTAYSGYLSNGVALVNARDINSHYESRMRDILGVLLNTYCNNVKDISDLPFNNDLSLSYMSFSSLGETNANKLCLLIDMYAKFTDGKSRQVLTDIARNMLVSLDKDDLLVIKTALKDRYRGTGNKLYGFIEGV